MTPRSDPVATLKLPDQFDQAIFGTVFRPDGSHRVIYSSSWVIWCLMTQEGMDAWEASEYFDFNIACAYLGPGTPIFI